MATHLLSTYYKQAGLNEDLPFAKNLKMPFAAFEHQVSGLNQALVHNRFGLFDEPGAGKSLVAQAWSIYYAHHGSKVVVVMPPTLLTQFYNTFSTNFVGFDNYFTKHVLNQPPKKRAELYADWYETEWPDMLLVSYQMFLREHREFMKAGYEVLCADEAHALKKSTSLIHSSVARFLGGKIEDTALLLMTGTPIPNTLEDTYGMIKLMSPKAYTNRKQWDRKHGVFVKKGNSADPNKKSWMELVGFQNQKELAKNMYRCARRILKNDVFSLDKPIIDYLPVTLDPTHLSLYKKLIKERFLELEEELIDATTAQSLRMKSLQMVTNPQRFKDAKIESSIVKTVTEKLDSIGIESKEKCVLVANFRHSIELLMETYAHLNPAVLYGGTKGPRQAQVDKFVKDETCRLVIIHPESGGVGIDGFQLVCKYMIFVEPTSVPGLFKQSSERLVRPGQKHVVNIWIVKALATVSPALIRNMLRKEGEAQQVNCDRTTMLAELMGQEAS